MLLFVCSENCIISIVDVVAFGPQCNMTFRAPDGQENSHNCCFCGNKKKTHSTVVAVDEDVCGCLANPVEDRGGKDGVEKSFVLGSKVEHL